MRKVYIVYKEKDDPISFYHKIIGVCATKELAEELMFKVIQEHGQCNISEVQWVNLIEEYNKRSPIPWDIIEYNIDELVEMFPDIPKEDIEKAYELYAGVEPTVDIIESDFYE